MMRHLIKFYTVCHLVFESQYDIAWTLHFLKISDRNIVCILVFKELNQ